MASATCGVALEAEALAPVEAIRSIEQRLNGAGLRAFGVIELGETSASQAIAVRDQLGIEDDHLNPDGGAIARGLPIGATGAVAVTRLFTRMVRQKNADSARKGIAAQGARGGIGVAAAFEAV